MKKALIVYYSYEGNVRSVMDKIHQELSIPEEALNPQNRLPQKSTLFTMLHGGKSALFKERADLSPLQYNPDDYEILILGWPLWAWSLPPAMREFLEKSKLRNKKIVLVVSSAGGAAKKCLKQASQLLLGNDIVAEFSLRDPLKRPQENEQKIKELTETVKKLIES